VFRDLGVPVGEGRFGVPMAVELTNEGAVTIALETSVERPESVEKRLDNPTARRDALVP
jgi:hypothetical protein